MWWYLFDAEQQIAVRQVLSHGDTLIAVPVISIAAVRAGLYCYPYIAVFFHQGPALAWGEWYTVIFRCFFFT
jgi:hypothetical protein